MFDYIFKDMRLHFFRPAEWPPGGVQKGAECSFLASLHNPE